MQTHAPTDLDDLLNDVVEDELILDKELEIALKEIAAIQEQLKQNLSQEQINELQTKLTIVYERFMTMLAMVKHNTNTLCEQMELEKARVDLKGINT